MAGFTRTQFTPAHAEGQFWASSPTKMFFFFALGFIHVYMFIFKLPYFPIKLRYPAPGALCFDAPPKQCKHQHQNECIWFKKIKKQIAQIDREGITLFPHYPSNSKSKNSVQFLMRGSQVGHCASLQKSGCFAPSRVILFFHRADPASCVRGKPRPEYGCGYSRLWLSRMHVIGSFWILQ